MVAITLYRGNLHRVSSDPRRWPLPPPSISIAQFKSLLRRRSVALSRLVSSEQDVQTKEESVQPAKVDFSDDSKPEMEVKEEKEEKIKEVKVEECDEKKNEANEDEGTINSCNEPEIGKDGVESGKLEANSGENATTEKYERKKEIEKKLQELSQKKHNLVQMLKQILNAEEEMKRRSNPNPSMQQSPVVRSGSATLTLSTPSENGPDVGSATRVGPPKITVDVNFMSDSACTGAESDPGSTHSTHNNNNNTNTSNNNMRPFYQIQSPSPSGSSLNRSPFSHHMPRGMPGVSPGSNSLLGNPMTSPACFAGAPGIPSHGTGLPPLLPLPGTGFLAASSSPAASGSVPSMFRDSRIGGGSS